MRFQEKYGPWALVAGASEGIGAAFAEEIAARRLNLLLVARRAGPLDDLAGRLGRRHGVEVRTASVDLGSPALLDEIRAAAGGIEIGLVVYNAAFSALGPFLDVPLADKLRVIDVNCRGPLILADEFGRAMAARGRGGMVIMASLAGTQGTPLVSTYAATKAFDLVLAEGLWDELRGRGVDVLACRAGATRTPTFERTRPRSNDAPMQEADEVAREALAALGEAPSVVTGRLNNAVAFVMGRLMPRQAAVAIMGRTMRKMYGSEPR